MTDKFVNFDDIFKTFSPEMQKEINDGAAVLIAEQRVYIALHEAYEQTRADIGRELALSPAQIDRVSHQSLMFIKALQDIFAQQGGKLTVAAELPGVARVEIKDLEDIT